MNNKNIKILATVTLAVLASGCANQDSAKGQLKSETSSTAVPSVNSVNPCALINDGELLQFDIPSHGETFNVTDEIGCSWGEAPRSIVIAKGTQGLDFFDRRASWQVKYLRNRINNRSGAIMQGSPTNTECSQVMAVGTGYVVVTMFYFRPIGAGPNYQYPPDPCSDALAIATIIEPRLPK